MEPQLGIIQEMERSIGHTLVIKRMADSEVMLASIDP
jgi:hypothetical protein